MSHAPRRFIVNFEDGTAEFNYNATPPAEEYVPLTEFNELESTLRVAIDALELIANNDILGNGEKYKNYADGWYGIAAFARNTLLYLRNKEGT